MRAISISLTKSWKLSLRKQELKPEMLQVLKRRINHIGTRCKHHTILQLNWKAGVQEGHQLAIMLQAKEGQDLREDRKEWKIFRELALA